jgi:hypothetical protein
LIVIYGYLLLNDAKGKTEMISWIKDNIGLKNVVILALVILVIVGFVKGPGWYKHFIGSQYEGIAIAKVTGIVAQNASAQHLNGTNTRTIGYELTYEFQVRSTEFSNTEFLEPGSEVKSLFDQFNSGKLCSIEIRYSKETPSKCMISKLKLNK